MGTICKWFEFNGVKWFWFYRCDVFWICFSFGISLWVILWCSGLWCCVFLMKSDKVLLFLIEFGSLHGFLMVMLYECFHLSVNNFYAFLSNIKNQLHDWKTWQIYKVFGLKLKTVDIICGKQLSVIERLSIQLLLIRKR